MAGRLHRLVGQLGPAEAAGGPLSSAELEQYARDGYVIPRNFRLSQDQLEAIKARHAHLVAAHPEFRDYCPALLPHDLGFLNTARQPQIMAMVRQLIGENVILWNQSLFAKPARTGRRVPWHQDGQYWPIEPLATCTCWIALDRSDSSNGCLRVIPGSHRPARLRQHDTRCDPANLALDQQLCADEMDEREAVDLVLEPGQVSLHDVYLVHGSEPNRSDAPRRGMTLRFMPSSSVFNRQTTEGKMKHLASLPLFLMSGRDLSGRNELQLMQTPVDKDLDVQQ